MLTGKMSEQKLLWDKSVEWKFFEAWTQLQEENKP